MTFADSTRFTRSEGITRHWTFVVSPCYTSGITSSNWLCFQHNLQLIEEKSMFILQRSQVIWSQDNITINTFWSNYRKCEQHFHLTRNAERFAWVLYRVTKTGWPRKTITTTIALLLCFGTPRYRAPTDFRPLRHIFVHFCGLPTAFMLHWQHYQVKGKCRQRSKWDSCFGNSQVSLMV